MSTHPVASLDEALLIRPIRRMIAAIGLPDTLKLLQTWGGTHLSLPAGTHRQRECQALAGLIGHEQAERFYAEFARPGQRRILVPKADRILIQFRDAEIVATAETMTVREQALHYRLTTRQIHKIRKLTRKAPAPSPQRPLFADLDNIL